MNCDRAEIPSGSNSTDYEEPENVSERTGIRVRVPSIGLRFPPRTMLGKTLFSLIVSALLLSATTKILSVRGMLMLITLSVLIYIIIDSATGSGRSMSLPGSTNPLPPRLGHDGVSLDVMSM